MIKFQSNFPLKIFKGPPYNKIREEYLNKLNDLFKSNQIVALCGPSGVGKTKLASEYSCYLTSNVNNPKIRWFYLDSAQNLEIEYKNLSNLLGFNSTNYNNDIDLSFIINFINSKLREFNDLLLVYDNVKSFDYIKNFISNIPKNVKILITTTNSYQFDAKIARLELESFNTNEAIEYMNNNMEIKVDHVKLNSILSSIKTNDKILPIRLDQLLSYLNYWGLNDLDSSLLNYSDDKMLLKLKSKNVGAYEILRYCSFFGATFVPIGFFNELPKLKFALLSETNLSNFFAIKDLERLGLVSTISKNNSTCIRLHDFDVKILKGLTESNETIELNIIKIVNEQFELVGKDEKSLFRNELYYTLALSMCNTLDYNIFDDNQKLADLINLFRKVYTYELNINKNQRNVLDKCLLTLSIAEDIYDEHDLSLAKYVRDAGFIYTRLNELEKAVGFYLREFEIYKANNRKNYDTYDQALCLKRLGACYNRLNINVSALEYSFSSYEMMRKVYKGKDSLDLAETMLYLGLSYLKMGKKELGFQFLSNCVTMSVKIIGRKDDFRIACLLKEVGQGYFRNGEYKMALDFDIKVLDMKRRLYRAIDHENLAKALSDVGLDYERLNEKSKAFEYKMRALEMRRRLAVKNEPKNNVMIKHNKRLTTAICTLM
jgi:hypothetical protein